MKTALRAKEDHSLIETSANLTSRQQQILDFVSIGHTNREIASLLKISVRTVEVHRLSLMRRLNVRNVAQLLRRALHLGLLSSRHMCAQLGVPGRARIVEHTTEGSVSVQLRNRRSR